jgi:DNA-binding beta-propeller fold protein YncE
MSLALLVLICLVSRLGQARQSDHTSAGLLLVASMDESKLDVLDEETGRTLASMPTGPRPHEVRVAPDGRRAYVVAGRTITAVDLRAMQVSATFDLGDYSAHDVRVSRDGRRLWAACAARQTVLELDAQSGAVLQHYATAKDGAWFVEVAPDAARLYTPNLEGKSVSIINRDGAAVQVVPFEHQVYGIDITPDGRHLWVSGRHLTVIDTATAAATRTVRTPEADSGRLRLTSDGARVVVAMARSLVVIDAETGRVIREIALDATPKVLALSGDDNRAYVSNPEVHSATIVDLVAGRVLRTVPTGRRPDGVAWALRPPSRAAVR